MRGSALVIGLIVATLTAGACTTEIEAGVELYADPVFVDLANAGPDPAARFDGARIDLLVANIGAADGEVIEVFLGERQLEAGLQLITPELPAALGAGEVLELTLVLPGMTGLPADLSVLDTTIEVMADGIAMAAVGCRPETVVAGDALSIPVRFGRPEACDADADGFFGPDCGGDDCDDDRSDVFPGGIEVCDGADNDCNGETDEAASVDAGLWFPDSDGDRFGDIDPGLATVACYQPDGYVADDSDCNDANPLSYPGADERCDLDDNDCDGEVDEPGSIGEVDWYADQDGDAFGDRSARVYACEMPPDHVHDRTDCDDARFETNPAADEYCNSIDDDCDGEIDEDDAVDKLRYHEDRDGDGYGNPDASLLSCIPLTGHVLDDTDCNDSRQVTYPGAEEICDGEDNDCDGLVDEDASGGDTWFVDRDADGFGDASATTTACAQPPGFADNADDCDDAAAAVFPGADEYCNLRDDDCDTLVDEDAVDGKAWFLDADGDSYGDPGVSVDDCTAPDGHVADASDCDDDDPAVNPGAAEVCDGIDNDCDGQADADVTWYADADGDGYGDPNDSLQSPSCTQPAGYAANADDCDDASATVFPGADETCNGVDDDCDAEVDEDDAIDAPTWYPDGDADGFGRPASAVDACLAPPGHSGLDTDCDDSNAAVYPGADEYCNGLDDDCDGTRDEYDALDASSWYRDADSDSFGNAADFTISCTEPFGFIADDSDCDDTSAAVYPGAEELCNGADDDCDGAVDEDAVDGTTYYVDTDGDGWGGDIDSVVSCVPLSGYVAIGGDCDDTNVTVYPGGTEVCDGFDNDCNGTIDDGSLDAITWYRDADTDGYGDPADTVDVCTPPLGYVLDDTDCDDGDAAVYPGADEYCNSADDDCDGTVDEDDAVDALTWYPDADGDTYGWAGSTTAACSLPAGYSADDTDCDDTQATIFPGAAETCNGADDDCDDEVDEDAVDATDYFPDLDGDGWGGDDGVIASCTPLGGYLLTGGDCDDTAGSVYPGATEVCDGLDNDCNGAIDDGAVDLGTWFFDADSDGFGDAGNALDICTPPAGFVANDTDCDDGNAAVFPGAPELCNSVDDDCDGDIDEGATDATTWYRDADGDTYGWAGQTTEACGRPSGFSGDATDCDDTDPTVNPGAAERCNGTDDDCDDAIDEDPVDGTAYFPDADADGWGADAGGIDSCVAIPGFLTTGGDCDDSNSTVNPGATEICDGLDNNCDGQIDVGAIDSATWYRDVDSDGFGDPSQPREICSPPPGYVADATDCDDTDVGVHPGADEFCNGTDDDCDGVADEDPIDGATWYSDRDGDGFGDPNTSQQSCARPPGYLADNTDCDDDSGWVFPGAPEICNGADDDCDGDVDEDAFNATDYYPDADNDGWGGDAGMVRSCDPIAGYLLSGGDCDDSEASVYPGGTEFCDGLDNDCNGVIDNNAVDRSDWWRDRDDDGFGDPNNPRRACDQPDGFTDNPDDCEDFNDQIYPGAPEICDGDDNDCNGQVDDNAIDQRIWYEDRDGDGYGNPVNSMLSCKRPPGYSDNSDDCRDGNPMIYPGAPEFCDGRDQNCNGLIDDDAVDAQFFWADNDNDGWGSDDDFILECWWRPGLSYTPGDCDDSNMAINPGMPDDCDGLDNDCSGLIDDWGTCPCPIDWYDDHAYAFCDISLSWTMARQSCRQYGYDLVRINNRPEDDFVTGWIMMFNGGSWWSGYNDRGTEGNWVWAGGGTGNYENWAQGEPNNWGNEDCMELNWGYSAGGRPAWNDADCGGWQPFVCESQ